MTDWQEFLEKEKDTTESDERATPLPLDVVTGAFPALPVELRLGFPAVLAFQVGVDAAPGRGNLEVMDLRTGTAAQQPRGAHRSAAVGAAARGGLLTPATPDTNNYTTATRSDASARRAIAS